MKLLYGPLVFVAVVASGCASVAPLRPLSGGTAGQAWQELSRTAAAGGSLSSYASVRVSTPEGRRSFRSTIQVGEDGRVSMKAFTPVGTEVFAFDVMGDEMFFAEHSSKKSWRGPFSEAASQLGIPAGLDAADFARLLFGLPAFGNEADLSDVADGIVRQEGLIYEVSGLGLVEARGEGTSWRVRYEPGRFPPESVTFDDESGRSIVVRHLDLSRSRRRIEPLVVDSEYECCFRPRISSD